LGITLIPDSERVRLGFRTQHLTIIRRRPVVAGRFAFTGYVVRWTQNWKDLKKYLDEAETQATSTTAPISWKSNLCGKTDHRPKMLLTRAEGMVAHNERTTWRTGKAIGRALEIWRTESMRAAHTNKPIGRATIPRCRCSET